MIQVKLPSLMHSPSFRTGTFGFLAGSIIPIMFVNLYLVPAQNYKDQKDLNFLRRSVGLMNWQVRKLENKLSGKKTNNGLLTQEGYQDGLYWAGF